MAEREFCNSDFFSHELTKVWLGVNFINRFVPNADLSRPTPNFYAIKRKRKKTNGLFKIALSLKLWFCCIKSSDFAVECLRFRFKWFILCESHAPTRRVLKEFTSINKMCVAQNNIDSMWFTILILTYAFCKDFYELILT